MSVACPGPHSQTALSVVDGTPLRSAFGSRNWTASESSVTIVPQCSDPPTLKNMCPQLLSGGVPCTQAGKCSSSIGFCTPGGSDSPKCTYDIDLLKDMRDVSFLLRSTSNDNQAKFPIRATAALIQNFNDRMKALGKETMVTPEMRADAACMIGNRRFIRTFVNGTEVDDFRSIRDLSPEQTDWGPIYWQQGKLYASIMSRPGPTNTSQTDFAVGNKCYVLPNCTSEYWDSTLELARLLDGAGTPAQR